MQVKLWAFNDGVIIPTYKYMATQPIHMRLISAKKGCTQQNIYFIYFFYEIDKGPRPLTR